MIFNELSDFLMPTLYPFFLLFPIFNPAHSGYDVLYALTMGILFFFFFLQGCVHRCERFGVIHLLVSRV